jgi:hypothetical protein
MNVALGTIIIIFLFSPGIIFRIAYLNGPYSKQNFKSSPVDELFWSIIPAVFIQFTGVLFVETFTPYSINLETLFYLIVGNASDKINFPYIKEALPGFLTYSFLTFVISGALGFGLRSLVKKLRLDLKYRFVRYNNDWYFLFSGLLLEFPGMPGDTKDIEVIQVDALTKTNEGNVLYSGYLLDFFLSKTEGLDRLYLTSVYRRAFKDDINDDEYVSGGLDEKAFDKRYYKMPGDIFVISYDQIINLNITYIQLEVADDDEEEPSK